MNEKKKFNWTKNMGLKIGSLVFAALMWVIVTNINDPVDSRTFDNIPVRIINAHIIENSNRVYEVLEETDIINRVTVRAPRSVIGRIAAANIIARADINDISSLDTVAITLEVNNLSPAEINEITGSSNILKLRIEDKRSRNFQIQPLIEGEIAEGYLQGDITFEPNIISISGPESLINSISYAAASVDITNFTNDISTNADIILYDSTGKQVSADRISQNTRNVSIKIPILEIKTVAVRYAVSGSPAAGYRLNGFEEISREQIEVAGKSSAVRDLSVIEIPAEKINISESTATFSGDIDLREYLPDNVRLVDPSENMVRITIGIEEEVTRSINLRENNFRIVNIPAGFTARFAGPDETVSLNLLGLQGDLERIRAADIAADLDIARLMADRDMEQMREGTYSVPAEIDLGSNVTVTNTVTVLLEISLAENN